MTTIPRQRSSDTMCFFSVTVLSAKRELWLIFNEWVHIVWIRRGTCGRSVGNAFSQKSQSLWKESFNDAASPVLFWISNAPVY